MLEFPVAVGVTHACYLVDDAALSKRDAADEPLLFHSSDDDESQDYDDDSTDGIRENLVFILDDVRLRDCEIQAIEREKSVLCLFLRCTDRGSYSRLSTQ